MAEEETKTAEAVKREPMTPRQARDPTRRVGDVIPSGNLWPDLPRRELDDLIDTELVIEDFSFLQGRYGQFAVILARLPGSSQQFTSACGGSVVCRKLEQLKDGRHLPVLGTISYNERYYDLTQLVGVSGIMGKWSPRHNNRRHLAQAANLIDNAIAHIVEIRESMPDEYEQHRQVLQVYAVALDDIKTEILGYRSAI